jgi:thiol-disulfide isomerase/thioredoxin
MESMKRNQPQSFSAHNAYSRSPFYWKSLWLCIALLGFILPMTATANMPDGYRLTFKVTPLKDTTIFLVSYFGSSNTKVDSMKINAKSEVVFQGAKTLPQGMYMLVMKGDAKANTKLFDFIVGTEQNFSITTDTSDYVDKTVVKGSKENDLFYGYLKFIAQKSKEVRPIQAQMEKVKNDPKAVAELRQKVKPIDEQVKKYQLDAVEQNKGTFFAAFLRTMREPEIPEPPKLPNGKIDSTFQYRYYRQHYFDEVDFNDERLWRSPNFYTKIEFMLGKMISQHPDTIGKEVIAICERAKGNKELFKLLTSNFTYKYETSNIVGQDAIFVQLAERYYLTKEAFWVHDSVVAKIEKRVKKIKPLLINQVGPNLSMQDTTASTLKNLHDIKARYTIAFFMDPDCGHCKKEMAKLKELYDKHSRDWSIEVYSVFADTSLDKMKKYIKENGLRWICVNGPRNYNTPYHDLYDINSTPVIYILDEKKRIISKKLPAESVEDFIKHHMRFGNDG